jgi:hypothetical protein
MKAVKVRLALAALLFASWIGWLVYLALTTTGTPILSRPQFLVSNLFVIADLTGDEHPDPTATVEEVFWSADERQDQKLQKQQVAVIHLPRCGPKEGWQGPGQYILPLTRRKSGKNFTYEVTPTPRSPGYPSPYHPGNSAYSPYTSGPPRIYPATRQTMRQLEQIRDEYGRIPEGE